VAEPWRAQNFLIPQPLAFRHQCYCCCCCCCCRRVVFSYQRFPTTRNRNAYTQALIRRPTIRSRVLGRLSTRAAGKRESISRTADLTPAYERARVRVRCLLHKLLRRAARSSKRSDGTRQTSHAAVRTPSLPWPRLPTHPAALCFWKKYPSMTSGPGLRLAGDATCPGSLIRTESDHWMAMKGLHE